jgi:hypothetical protein
MTAFADKVFVFTGATLEEALNEWVETQITAFPHQADRIQITALAMRDFFMSSQIERHKMVLGGRRHDR